MWNGVWNGLIFFAHWGFCVRLEKMAPIPAVLFTTKDFGCWVGLKYLWHLLHSGSAQIFWPREWDFGSRDQWLAITGRAEVLPQWEMWAVPPVLDPFKTPTKVSGGLGSNEHKVRPEEVGWEVVPCICSKVSVVCNIFLWVIRTHFPSIFRH